MAATAKKLLCMIYAMLTEGGIQRRDDLFAYRKMRRMESAAASIKSILRETARGSELRIENKNRYIQEIITWLYWSRGRRKALLAH